MTTQRENLDVWVIYENPLDAPGKFVVRRHTLDGPTEEAYQVDTLDGAREVVPIGLVRIPRETWDEPQIVETWI